MKTLVLMLLISAHSLNAAEIKLKFSNGWTVELDDTKFANHDYEKIRIHHNFEPILVKGTLIPRYKGNFLSGLFKYTTKTYTRRRDLSVIQFTMTSREWLDSKHQGFLQTQIQFETKKKVFEGMTNIAEALNFTLAVKNLYKATEKDIDDRYPERATKTEANTTLVSMTIDGVQQEPEKTSFAKFWNLLMR